MNEREYALKSVLDIQHGGNHYKDRGIQPIEFAQANNLDWKQFNVVKYTTRHKDKNGAEDLKKAIHYLQMALEFDYGIRTKVEYDSGLVAQTQQVGAVLETKQVEPWYPDDSGEWIEFKADKQNVNPANGQLCVEVLTSFEREDKFYHKEIGRDDCFDWSGDMEDHIVAYKIVNKE